MSTKSSLNSTTLNLMRFSACNIGSLTVQHTNSTTPKNSYSDFSHDPTFNLKLTLNTLNIVKSGSAKSWALKLMFGVDLNLPKQKIEHFHLYPESFTSNGSDRFLLTHRSWSNQQGRILLPVDTYSANSHKFILTHSPFNPAYMMFASITDGSGRQLMEVKWFDD